MRARWRVLIGSGVVLVAAAAGYTLYAYETQTNFGRAEPAAGAFVASGAPTITVKANASALSDVRVMVDGTDLSERIRAAGGGLAIEKLRLPDGEHTVQIEAHTGGLFGGPRSASWSFTTDTQAPPLTVLAPAAGKAWAHGADVLGRSEPGTTARVEWDGGSSEQVVAADGLFRIVPDVPAGDHQITVAVRDAAGNTTSSNQRLRFDNEPPVLPEPTWPEVEKTTSSPVLEGQASDNLKLKLQIAINGEAVKPTLTPTGFRIETHRLAQGLSTIEVTASDRAGNAVSYTRQLLIDSTEKLKANLTLRPGAVGRDVLSLTRRLRLEGAWKRKKLTRTYDNRVVAAVKRYQKQNDMVQDGIARPALLTATQGKIVIDKSKFRLRAYRDGKLVLTFPIAIGQARYPSPTGTFVVTEKLKNPTWIPPNSPWAKGLEPIPPGSGNPLGTRWIGTSAPAVGIHGTPSSNSIGTAASHGCIRMHIRDVEKLFEFVDVGESVVFKT
jgi:lipoprotein-anchoring transpeptidase ErfK/SrfK